MKQVSWLIACAFLSLVGQVNAQSNDVRSLPDYSIQLGYGLLDEEWHNDLQVRWAPKLAQPVSYRFGWQQFNALMLKDTDVSVKLQQVSLAWSYEWLIDNDSLIAPQFGVSINATDIDGTDIAQGDTGWFAGVDYQLSLSRYFQLVTGVKHYLDHPIFAGETSIGVAIQFSAVPDRIAVKPTFCDGCFYILLGSFRDDKTAEQSLAGYYLDANALYKVKNPTSVEIYLGGFDSFSDAQRYQQKTAAPGSVVRRSSLSLW